jgi:hypothetical protein
VVGIEGLDRALSARSNLYAAVERLRPLNLLVYIIDEYGYLLYKLGQIIHLTIPVAILDLVRSLPAEIIALPKMLLVLALLFLSVMALPITVIIEGTLFDSVIVFIIFLPMWILLVALKKNRLDDSAASNVLFGTAIAVAITIFLFWVVQLAMMGALYVFGDLIKLAQIIVGGSLIGYVGYWAASHSVEHSVTERVVHSVKTAILKEP